ncbi:hypothetical protein ACJMK2_012290 [Sinanodonta woodiana]|uniref:Uncharacterized protein n=1 Tax=Sinanodonta woodiana TaxID=1069815 RepID=A0ABD3V9S9_SINWO
MGASHSNPKEKQKRKKTHDDVIPGGVIVHQMPVEEIDVTRNDSDMESIRTCKDTELTSNASLPFSADTPKPRSTPLRFPAFEMCTPVRQHFSLEDKMMIAEVLHQEHLRQKGQQARIYEERRIRLIERKERMDKEARERLQRKMREVEERRKFLEKVSRSRFNQTYSENLKNKTKSGFEKNDCCTLNNSVSTLKTENIT